jgi:hypothetical protein
MPLKGATLALPFLRSETEDDATQAIAFIGICIVTVGLTIMNVSGAIAGSKGDGGLWIIRGALAIILSGAELLAAVALVRVMMAPNLLRKIVGSAIFIGLAWACIQNGKRAVHLIYPEFESSAALLQAQAKIAGDNATAEKEARDAAKNAVPALLAKVQADIAAAKRDQMLLQAQSPEKIAQAQQMLITNGYYFYQVDGKIGPETEKAMRLMGEDLRNKLENLEAQEANLIAGVTTVQAASAVEDMSPAERQAELTEKARKAKEATIWLEVMLWVFEAARSFGLWALVVKETSKSGAVDPNRSEAAKKGWETRKAKEETRENIPVRDDGYWTERIRKALKTKMRNPTAEGMWNTYFPGLASVHELRGKLSVRVKRGQLSQRDFDFIMREGEFAPPPPKEYPVARQDEPEIEPDNEDDEDAPPVAAE